MFSLVLPTYNESGNILPMLRQAHEALRDYSHEILVVDDDSPDGTWKLAEEFGRANPWVRVIRRIGKRGLSSAALAGFEAAQGNIMGAMDADLSHDERILPALIGKVEEGCDLAVGSRRISGGGATAWPWYRRLSSTMATLMAKSLLNLELSDSMSGFFVMKRSLFERCHDRLMPQGYKILLEIYCQGRPLRLAEVPYIFKDRRQNVSKLTPWVMVQYVRMLLRLKKEFSQRCGRAKTDVK